MILDKNFQEHVSCIDLASIQNSLDTVYIVDHEMKLRAYNRAWVNFASENGEEHIIEKYPLGTIITGVGEDPVKSFIKYKYSEAISAHKIFELSDVRLGFCLLGKCNFLVFDNIVPV